MPRTLSNNCIAWHLQWDDGILRSTRVDNGISGRTLALSSAGELTVVLSAEPERIAEPLSRISDFAICDVQEKGVEAAVFSLRSVRTGIDAELHFQLEGAVRRKRAKVKNSTDREILLLDIVLDELLVNASIDGGGQGQPVFLDGELWAAVEHPSGYNDAADGRIRLSHCPGRRLLPGETTESRTSLVGAAPAGNALPSFVSWIQGRSQRLRNKVVSVYTPFGINNQWGLCSTLDDEQILHVLGTLEKWRKKGAMFDYFTLDTGWVDYGSDLTRFRPVGFPEGAAATIRQVESQGMKFGLWFATSWASQSCWDYQPAWGGGEPPALTWRNGHAAMAEYSGSFCLAAGPYFQLLKDAVLHHVRNNNVRFLKFDGGSYACDDPAHGHLPGKYAMEKMHDLLIELAEAARAEAARTGAARRKSPDLFIMWYWGLRSPFWALHGDTIFESGLFMEGSGTSVFPALHYRDSVTLAQDQNAFHARTIPPAAKDSLGVWLADTRWGNYLGRERWREALVMDLGRGNLLFPNLWGDIYLLDEDDVAFLARMSRFARRNEDLLLRPRALIGDPMRNDAYGYAYGNGSRGLVFLNNAHFASRGVDLSLGPGLGLDAKPGTRLCVDSRFPESRRLLRDDGTGPRIGDTLSVRLRPFEVLLLRISPAGRGVRDWTRRLGLAANARLPRRAVGSAEAARLGIALELRGIEPGPDLDVRFADAARFARLGYRQAVMAFETTAPVLDGEEQPFLAVTVRLRRAGQEWKYSPVVAEIVQATARIGGERVHLVPVPDARQFGNTQKAGCSWVVYKTRLSRRWSGAQIRLAVHAFVPADVEALVEAWVVRRWWSETARPVGDGYYADAPS